MITPKGTQVYLIDNQPELIGCVTSIAGIGESARMRDRTALTSRRKTEVPADTESKDITLHIIPDELRDAIAYLRFLRGLKDHRFAIALGKGDPLTLYHGQPVQTYRNIISFYAYVTDWSLENIEFDKVISYSLKLKPLSPFEINDLGPQKPGAPWQGGNPWLKHSFWMR